MRNTWSEELRPQRNKHCPHVPQAAGERQRQLSLDGSGWATVGPRKAGSSFEIKEIVLLKKGKKIKHFFPLMVEAMPACYRALGTYGLLGCQLGCRIETLSFRVLGAKGSTPPFCEPRALKALAGDLRIPRWLLFSEPPQIRPLPTWPWDSACLASVPPGPGPQGFSF